MRPNHQKGKGRDKLTQLDMYDVFLAVLEKDIAEAEEDGTEVSLGLIDIDRFGKLNADHGPAVGDGVLVLLAEFLARNFAESGKVFRYGGDAFAVLLNDTDKETAFLRLEEARQEFEGEHNVWADGGRVTLPLRISAGVASYPADGARAQEVIRKVNEALYRSKVNGGNKICLAREEKMVTKTSHYTQGQLHGLSRLAKREGLGEAELLREALDDLLRKHNA